MATSGEVEVVAITKQFGSTLALDNISLKIPESTYCCLLGPSGCGKTTLLRIIAGHETASSGRVFIDAVGVDDLPVGTRGVAMMFQSYALFPHLSVAEGVAFSLKMRGVGRAERDRRALEVLHPRLLAVHDRPDF